LDTSSSNVPMTRTLCECVNKLLTCVLNNISPIESLLSFVPLVSSLPQVLELLNVYLLIIFLIKGSTDVMVLIVIVSLSS